MERKDKQQLPRLPRDTWGFVLWLNTPFNDNSRNFLEYTKIPEKWEAVQSSTYRISKHLKLVAQIVYWVMIFMKCGCTSKWKLIMYSSRDYITIRHKSWSHHRSVSIPELRWLIPNESRILYPCGSQMQSGWSGWDIQKSRGREFRSQLYYGVVSCFVFLLPCIKT